MDGFKIEHLLMATIPVVLGVFIYNFLMAQYQASASASTGA